MKSIPGTHILILKFLKAKWHDIYNLHICKSIKTCLDIWMMVRESKGHEVLTIDEFRWRSTVIFSTSSIKLREKEDSLNVNIEFGYLIG